VSARRAELAPRISKFVNQIAPLENAEGLAVWKVPVCPLVSGLPQPDGEFILGRVTEIARAAGVPLGDEHCHPNLFILVTADPNRLLQGWNDRDRLRLLVFGQAAPSVTREFIETPRAVRVWYSSSEEDAWGKRLSGDARSTTGCQRATCAPIAYDVDSSHLQSNVVWKFSRIFVIADQRRLQGVSRGQFADYVAMIGLAELKTGAELGDAPTILKLFDGEPQTAAAGMSDWDQAFLKSLYATEPRSQLQRRQVARAMVREIVH
jgi:hypothetical protein